MWLSSLGYLTVLVDADAGFRNLDIALGLESNVVYDYSDCILSEMDIDEVLTKSYGCENLYFIAAPQSKATSDFDGERTRKFWDGLKSRFDYVLADAPAGMGDGFMFAAEYADEAIIVSLAEAPSLRDADRVIERLENCGVETIRLVLNRIQPSLISDKIQMNVDDCIDVLSVPILGIVPEDCEVAKALSQGVAAAKDRIGAGQAFFNIARRITGESIHIMDIDKPQTLWQKIFKSHSK
jgi:septum site-determining protein MinD